MNEKVIELAGELGAHEVRQGYKRPLFSKILK